MTATNERSKRLANRFADREASAAGIAAATSLLDETETAPSPQRPERPKKGTAPRWEDQHKRWTVWLPVELVAEINELAERRGESKMTTAALLLRAGLDSES